MILARGASDGEVALADPALLDDNDGVRQFSLFDPVQGGLQPVKGLGFAVVASPKEDQARAFGPREGKEPRVVQVSGDYDPTLCSCPGQDGIVARTVQANVESVNGIMALSVQPVGERG